jgi:hypothetical protein
LLESAKGPILEADCGAQFAFFADQRRTVVRVSSEGTHSTVTLDEFLEILEELTS